MPRISTGLNDALTRLPLDKGLRKAVDNQRDAICAIDMSERDLLSPERAGPVSIIERRAIAVYVAALHHERELVDRYLTLLAKSDGAGPALAHVIEAEARRAAAHHPAPHLPAPTSRALIGERLAVVFAHIQALLTDDRRGQARTLGWSADALGVVSRIMTLIIFQVRMIAGLRQCAIARQNVVPLAPEGYSHDV